MSERTLYLSGWMLFIISALGFTWSSLKSGDLASLMGSLLFLVACFFFVIPLLRQQR